MKYINVKIENKPKKVHVVLLNDLHFGSDAVDYDLLQRVFDFVDKNRDNTRILINGDIIQGITQQSKGSLYEQRITPEEQIEMAVEYLKPYADLIDCVTKGNHDWRIEEETSIDVIKMFCRYLGIEDKYAGYEAVVGYSWNGCFYSVEMYHGTGGGATLGSVERNLKKFRKSTADVMYCGHWHKEVAIPFKEYNVDPFNHQVKERKKWLICGNTIVRTENYAKKFRYQEGFPSQCYLTLNGVKRNKNIKVSWIR
jgi:hypothetical protein